MKRTLLTAAVVALVAGYAVADCYDVVPGVLTTDPPVHVDEVPELAASANRVDPVTSLSADAPAATNAGEKVKKILDDAKIPGDVGADIRDALTGDSIFVQDADTAYTPASVTKILTASAALSELGAEHRFTTSTTLSGVDGSTGTLHLVGGGDVLLGAGESDPDATMGHAGLGTLAHETAAALGEEGVTSVELSADLSRYTGPDFNGGWERADIGNGYIAPIQPLMVNGAYTGGVEESPREEDPAQVAVDDFASALQEEGITVKTVDPSTSPEDTRELASVESASVNAIVDFMMLYSDNLVAEVLGREVSVEMGEEPSGAQSPASVIAALEANKIPTGSITLSDVSGLDYDNRISPADLTSIVEVAARSQTSQSMLIPSLPVGGLSGTLTHRYTSDDSRAGAGKVSAKTGTLSTVTSLAGSVVTADGRLLVFSLMTDDLESGAVLDTRAALDRAVAAMAECGCS